MTPDQKQAESSNVQNAQKHSDSSVLFSPRQVAAAIGASESSLKRWCDAGTIQSSKTAGGHRRMTKSNVVEFLRQKSYSLRDPMAIGLPDINTVSIHNIDDAITQLSDAIARDDQKRCREIIVYLYINECEMTQLFDQVVAPVFKKIGAKWESGDLEVYQERRACEMCLNVFRELKLLLPTASENSLLAIGASPPHDHYMLPTTAVEITLIANGWDARSLGSNIPFESLLKAVHDYKPALVWISVSNVEDKNELINQLNEFASKLGDQSVLVAGGYALDVEIRTRLQNTLCCDNLSQLVSTIKNLKFKPRPNDQPVV